ncbi:hypothetical protein [Aphanothece sacrum]|uniref:Endopeptidase IV n=1 Tax=Aphanothece sacrum FPU1 TaxID=1920663 RepID=A0A401IDE2_APHSA|nr:hypothetical protein [Aphanothece sacrum]GBF79323.1 endopeptidase IV [Aphanothece sacrum FPU1]GBF86825.1 endopeptidase IV [Aphanothece sacrum FPU3]
MSVPITIESIEKHIRRAEATGVPEAEIDELRQFLDKLKTPGFKLPEQNSVNLQIIQQDGQKIIRFSTSSLISDEDFEGLDIKPV